MTTISEHVAVTISLKIFDSEGALLEDCSGEKALSFTCGDQAVPKALEEALRGKEKGDGIDIRVSAAKAFGERDESWKKRLHLAALRGVDELAVGDTLTAESEHGGKVYTVVALEPDAVVLDANHPLAGKDLRFVAEVLEVKADS